MRQSADLNGEHDGQLRCDRISRAMSAIGRQPTFASALHMSAFGGKADMGLCGISLSRSLSGVKGTCHFAPQMSAYDPKRTYLCAKPVGSLSVFDDFGRAAAARLALERALVVIGLIGFNAGQPHRCAAPGAASRGQGHMALPCSNPRF